ncbi:MAG TPA: response regulator, partial [Pirellulales bacterium]|nr:response regulator [Pirellulales bacterium]
QPTARSNRRCLVVDDNQDSAASMALILRTLGEEVQVAYDGLEAVQIAREYQPGLILLDIGLPKLHGYEAGRQIRRLPGGDEIVLVAVTGWGQQNDRARSKEAGFDHHLVKPLEMATVRALVAQPQAVE